MRYETNSPITGLERGSQATAALQHINVRELLVIRAKATFQPIGDDDIAPVMPCESCHDGGLRVVGRFRGKTGWQRVHACDTCGAIRTFELPKSS